MRRPTTSERWSRRPLVQLRHTGSGFWLLLWQDRRGRWQRYPAAPRPTRDLDALLAEIDEDGISLCLDVTSADPRAGKVSGATL